MNKRNFVSLLVGVLALGLLYVFLLPSWEEQGAATEHRLLEGVDGAAVSKLKIEQRKDVLELARKDGAWVVPSRNNYPADSAKIRGLLLKIFDLTVSQEVPGAETALDQLGLSDAAIEKGFTKVTFFDAAGKELGALRIGEARKSRDRSPVGAMSGQYVRRDSSNAVYLAGSPLMVAAEPASWLEVNLVNVLPAAVRSVTQVQSTGDKQEMLFELVRAEASGDAVLPPMTLQGGVPGGKALQDAAVTQVRSGLENVRLSDVFVPGSETVKDLTWDFLSVYKTTNGLVYRVETAQREERTFAKLRVQFDDALASELRAEAERKAAASPTPSATPTAQATGTPASASTPEPKPALTLSNAEEAGKLDKHLGEWIFELPGYQARKLRYTKSDLVEPPPPPPQRPSNEIPFGDLPGHP